MNKPNRKSHPIVKMINSLLIDLPSPSSISLWWNLGSMLSLCLAIQIMTGVFLAMHYTANIESAYDSLIHIMRDVNGGWLLRNMHANGASMFFACMYLHIARGLYYASYRLTYTWLVGISILLISMATAFLGYVLPWGQMSLWGATVITNLVSVMPYLGKDLVLWLWGGFAIENATLTRFFTLHFLLPFMITALVMIHLLMLHQTGSNNPIGLNSDYDKIPFHPYFSSKDLMGATIVMFGFMALNLLEPRLFSDPENFIPANPLTTPVHIQPEWYFLFAYAILRSIPNKMGGVIAMLAAILILTLSPTLNKMKFSSTKFYPLNKMMYWTFTFNWILLTWVGAQPAEQLFVATSQALSAVYFTYYLLSPLSSKTWDWLSS